MRRNSRGCRRFQLGMACWRECPAWFKVSKRAVFWNGRAAELDLGAQARQQIYETGMTHAGSLRCFAGKNCHDSSLVLQARRINAKRHVSRPPDRHWSSICTQPLHRVHRASSGTSPSVLGCAEYRRPATRPCSFGPADKVANQVGWTRSAALEWSPNRSWFNSPRLNN